MGNSFQDQFLKLGIVKKEQVNKTKKKQHKQKKQAKVDAEVEKSKSLAKKVQAEKKDYNKLLNQQKAEEQKLKEQAHRIQQLVENYRIDDTTGDISYKFTSENKIRKIYTKQNIVDQLGAGHVAIVLSMKKFELVPSEVGKKIGGIDQAALVLLHEKKNKEGDPDDPYAEFEVPDDLMW